MATDLVHNPIETDSTSLWVVGPLTFEQYAEKMTSLTLADRALPWWIGDLFNWAVDQAGWGEVAYQALPAEIGPHTAETYAWVCNAFPRARPAPMVKPDGWTCLQHGPDCQAEHFRHPDLTLADHRVVAPLCRTSPALAQLILGEHATGRHKFRELRARVKGERERLLTIAQAVANGEPVPQEVIKLARAGGEANADRLLERAVKIREVPLARAADRIHRRQPGICPTCTCKAEETT